MRSMGGGKEGLCERELTEHSSLSLDRSVTGKMLVI